MLDKFEKLASVLETILASKNHNNGPQMLTGSHIEVVSEIIRLLAPFKVATVQISAEKYITANIVLPLCHNVLDTLHDYKPTTSVARELKTNLLKEIEIKHIPLEKINFLILQLCSIPSSKEYSFSSLLKAEARSQICLEIKETAKQQDFFPILEESACEITEKTADSIWIKHEERFKEHSAQYMNHLQHKCQMN